MRQNSSHILKSKTLIKEGFFDVLSNLFKKPEQESNTPDELNQYLQQLQDTLDENEIYDEEVSKLVDQLKDSDYIDLVDFPTMIRGLENKLLKSGDKNVIIADYLTRLLKSLPKRAKYEKNLLKGEIPSGVDYYDEVEQEKSRVPKKVFKTEKELLQIELLKLQEWVKKNNVPVAIVFEGRDTAGKGSTIKQITEYLDPKYFNIVALGIPTEEEKKNWFKRYEKYIEPGKITFFDRSWYNRGIVEPVMGYSSKEEYEQFMKEVVPFEKSLLSRGVILIKFWLSITQGKQEQRFMIRQQSPLKYWKYSPNDEASREKWDEYTEYKERVFKDTSHSESPWVVLDSNDKRVSALNAMRHILDQVGYDSKDTNIVKSKYPEAISTIRRELNEQKESTRFTNSAIKILNMAWLMSNGSFRTFTQNLIKFFNIPPSTAEDLTFLCRYNIRGGNEKAEDWILPTIYESTVYVYGDYETETYYDECDSEGTTKEYGEECECLSGEIEDEDDGEYRPCTQDELDDIHYDDDCECEEWDDPEIDLYYYPIYEKTVYSTSDPDELGCVSDSHHDLSDYMECLDYSGYETVEVMDETHYEDTESVIEDEFEWDKDQTIADWEYDIDVNEWSGDYMVNKINEIYPDKSTTLNEEQLSLFPTGEWRLPTGQESELEDLQKELPEPLVKAVFRLWDKQEPITMNSGDLKLFGIPQSNRLLIALIVRYLQNTTRPVPVIRVWDCEDLTLLFNKDDRNIVEKYLCEEDFDYDNMYGYDEWYEGMLDDLDDMSWKYITTVLGVDKSTAENLLEGNPQSEEEEEIGIEKKYDIDRIKDLIRFSNERAAADVTFVAIRNSIKDTIEEHFDYTGKLDYDDRGQIMYVIKADLKDYVQDPEVWDNTDRFNNHEDYGGRHLEDILYDFDLTDGGYTNSIPQLIFNLFMENDFAIWWDSYKDYLSVDSKYFEGYWYPHYDVNQDFREYMMEEYYEELRGNINEQKNYDAEIELGPNNAYIEETPITKEEARILNLVIDKFSQQELTELTTVDYHEIGSDLENKWVSFVKLIGESTNSPEDFTKSTRWAKWVLDNLDKAEYVNEEGEIIIDFNNVDVLTKNYPSIYEVEGDEALWQKEFRQATVDMPAFSEDDARQKAENSFWEYEPDFETYDYGDADSDYFNIEDIRHHKVLKEQIIDIENLPKEELSPDLVEGDKVFVWDVDPDPAPPGNPTNPIPSTFIGVVTEVIPDDAINDDSYRGGIKYVIDTTSGLIGLYQGTIMSGSWTHGFKRENEIGELRRDKWVKLNKENIQEIKKITEVKNIERQKDFILKKSFMESINNLTEKDISPVKNSVLENRVTLFTYLNNLSEKNIINEEELSHLLVGGKNWTDRFTISNSIDLDDLKESSNKIRDIIFHNSKLQLNHIVNPSFIDVKRNVLNESKRVVKLWTSQNMS